MEKTMEASLKFVRMGGVRRLCWDCERLTNTSLNYNRSLLCYTDALRQWMYLYKYKGKETLSSAFSKLLATGFSEFYLDVHIDLITSVPLHPTRLLERGFNQSEQMAKGLSGMIKIPYRPLLLRQKPTEKQSKKDRQSRLISIRGTFHPLLQSSSMIQPKHVLIVDDVYTTGATLEEAAKVLKGCGVQRVYSLTVAR
ncbi:ComF family protein [Microaerobacter geothermalis]|uniref:ComF family protein n=1 Tax=Microaerobacter geothermalis TaxID=674972 RepID=UPI001F24D6C1|nr:ComF family protein [Microaerobacter geothermalis]MCF6093403.1 ComF family protein [Microaerobacter geothermalis]